MIGNGQAAVGARASSIASTAVDMPGAPARNIAVVIELETPLPGHRGEVMTVELRKPEFGDWLECGDIHETLIHDPRSMQHGAGGAVQVKVNHEAVGKWFARLSGLPMGAVTKLSMPDARRVLKEVVALVGSLDSGN